MRKHHTRIYAAAFGALLTVVLAGCGGGDKKAEKKTATQVAAKVDSEEISVHQINNVLAKSPGIPQDKAEQAKREILNRLVDQQVAVNKAVEQKLDRTPETMMAIEASRREILARAYLEKFASQLPKPTDQEIKSYYSEHPQLFAQRRVYNLQELTIQPQEGLLPSVQEKVAGAKSMDEVAAWLKSKNLKFNANAGARAAEQVPMEILPRLHETKDGQTIVVGSPQAIAVLKVLASQNMPVDEKAAAPRIAQFLMNRKASEAIAAEMKQLKEKAKIEYVGEFSSAAPAATPSPASAEQKPAAAAIEQGAAKLIK